MTLNSQTRSPLRADHARELSNIGKRAARYWVLAETVSIASSYDAAGHAAVATFQLGATYTSVQVFGCRQTQIMHAPRPRGRRPKSAKARNRGWEAPGGATDAMGIWRRGGCWRS